MKKTILFVLCLAFIFMGFTSEACASSLERFITKDLFMGKVIFWEEDIGDYVSNDGIEWVFYKDGTFNTNFSDERLGIDNVSGTYQIVGRAILLNLSETCALCPRPVVLTNIKLKWRQGYISFIYDRTWTMTGGQQSFVAFELFRQHY